MGQTSVLIRTLKRVLKNHDLTYQDVAQALDLSEATVKRRFSQASFSLEQLDHICQLVDMEISDLVKEMESGQVWLTELTEAQEQEVVSDDKLLVVAFHVINGWTLDDIHAFYKLTKAEIVHCLTRMDRLRLIDLLPENRIRLLISANFAWRKNGPIQRFFTEHVQADFLGSLFDLRGESLMFLSGMLSRNASTALIGKMEKLAAEFNELYREEQLHPLTQRVGYSLLLALRPWQPGVFEHLRR